MAVANYFYGYFMPIDLGATRASFMRKNTARLAPHVFCRRFIGGFGTSQLAFLGNSIQPAKQFWYLHHVAGHSHCPRFPILGGCLHWRNHLALLIRPMRKTPVNPIFSRPLPFSLSFCACPAFVALRRVGLSPLVPAWGGALPALSLTPSISFHINAPRHAYFSLSPWHGLGKLSKVQVAGNAEHLKQPYSTILQFFNPTILQSYYSMFL